MKLTPTKQTVRSVLSRAVVYGGASAVSRAAFPKRGAVVFYAHRLATDSLGFLLALRPDWFEEQIAHLVRHYTFISLTALVEHFETGTQAEQTLLRANGCIVPLGPAHRAEQHGVAGLANLERVGRQRVARLIERRATNGSDLERKDMAEPVGDGL